MLQGIHRIHSLPAQPRHKPFLQFLILLAYSLLGAIIFTMLGLGLAAALSGQLDNPRAAISPGVPHLALNLKIVQLFSAIGTFIVPAWLLSRSQGMPFNRYYLFRPLTLFIILALIILAYSIQPAVTGLQAINLKLSLPQALSGLQQWMHDKEDDLQGITKLLLSGSSGLQLLFNLVVIALVPAIGEELVFRGALQPILLSLIKNKHIAIWLTAFIFAAIHMQFYSALPRMLLGLVFGYLYYYTHNLWPGIILHFINNGTAVAGYYYYTVIKHTAPTQGPETLTVNPAVLIFSVIVSLLCFFFIVNKYQHVQPLDKDIQH